MKAIRAGFTLIELLIVVAIIGILAVALVPTISDAPARARDAARKTMVNNVITAVESYNIDEGGYPVATSWVCLSDTSSNTSVTALVADYLGGNAPTQPAVGNPPSTEPLDCLDSVAYQGSASSYKVAVLLEKANGTLVSGAESTAAAENRYFVVSR